MFHVVSSTPETPVHMKENILPPKLQYGNDFVYSEKERGFWLPTTAGTKLAFPRSKETKTTSEEEEIDEETVGAKNAIAIAHRKEHRVEHNEVFCHGQLQECLDKSYP